MIKQVKRPLTMVNLSDFNKDFYMHYKPNSIKNRLLLFHERLLQKEQNK